MQNCVQPSASWRCSSSTASETISRQTSEGKLLHAGCSGGSGMPAHGRCELLVSWRCAGCQPVSTCCRACALLGVACASVCQPQPVPAQVLGQGMQPLGTQAWLQACLHLLLPGVRAWSKPCQDSSSVARSKSSWRCSWQPVAAPVPVRGPGLSAASLKGAKPRASLEQVRASHSLSLSLSLAGCGRSSGQQSAQLRSASAQPRRLCLATRKIAASSGRRPR